MMQRLIPIGSTVLGTLMAVNPAQSQIIPDRTTNTTVVNNCQASCDLTGGIVAEDNLFHSFQEFNVAPEASVYFDDPGVANIFSRVTGSNPSEIFGTLGVKGGANLFLLNPNGIVFGEGASLDLNGSFFATTADTIQFGERDFSAIPDAENLSLLTVNPSALLFNQIRNGAIVLDNADLTVPQQQNIALLGQGIELKNSNISVTEGNISLAAVDDDAEISLSNDFQLEFPANVLLGDVSIIDGSQINSFNLNSSGDRQIKIDSNNLKIIGNSTISTTTIGANNGADIKINANSSVKIIGTEAGDFQQFIASSLNAPGDAVLKNGLRTNTLGTGSTGNIQITTPELFIDRGAGIVSATNSQGDSGNIDLNVADNLMLRSSGLLTGSSISSSGNVGEVKINTQQLLIEKNAVISSSTLGSGNAGSVDIAASDTVKIKDTMADAIVPTGIFTNTIFETGSGGNLKINTPRLILQNGGQLSASSGGVFITPDGFSFIPFGGEGGNIDLKIDKLLKIEGTSVNGEFASSILSDTRSSSPAGNITIETSKLINNDGLISTSSLGSGAGGNIAIDASSINIEGAGSENIRNLFQEAFRNGRLEPENARGGIAAFTTNDSEAGSITIGTNSLNLDLGAVISTATFGNGDAGNLTVRASEEINVRGSAIISPTFDAGDGGYIDLETKNLSVIKGGAIASITTGTGRAGDMRILATEAISIFEIVPDLLFSGTISTGSYGGTGKSGNLTIDTQRLSIGSGANIETTSVFAQFNRADAISSSIDSRAVEAGTQGQLTINATESIEISGEATEVSDFNPFSNSHIYSITNTSNPASNVEINTGKLSISDGGEISVRSSGRGAAGTLVINADSIALRNEGKINGTTVFGQGGNIDLQIAGILEIDDRSVINTDALIEGNGNGNGGNINIAADFVVARSASSISAGALQEGTGGNIIITANDVFLTDDSSITADSAMGIDGTVEVRTLFNTERDNLSRLPQQVIQADNQVVRSCSTSDRQGVFSYIGRGGLPFNPLTDFQTDEPIIADLDIPTPIELKRQIQPEVDSKLDLLPAKTVEADGWQVNDNGKIELIANNNSTFGFAVSHCPTSNRRSQLKIGLSGNYRSNS